MLKKVVLFVVLSTLGSILSLGVTYAESVVEETSCPLDNDQNLNSSVEKGVQKHNFLMNYIVQENGLYYFDEALARNDNVSEFDIETGIHLVYLKNQEIQYGEKEVFENTNEAQLEMIEPYAWHRYGNYCGFGNSGGNPVNPVDRSCMIHDNCYEDNGWGSCECDADLISAMSGHAKNGNLTVGQRSFAAAALAHFSSRYAAGLCI